jgi:glyoxylase I family protein
MLGNNTLFGLHQHKTPAGSEGFSEYRVGLDHVSFGCANRGELEQWARRLDELAIQHGGIKDATYGSGVSFRDPDGIALRPTELSASPVIVGSALRQPSDER